MTTASIAGVSPRSRRRFIQGEQSIPGERGESIIACSAQYVLLMETSSSDAGSPKGVGDTVATYNFGKRKEMEFSE